MKRILAWAVALSCGASSAFADGLLAKRYAEVSYLGATWHEENTASSARVDIESGKGVALAFNTPLAKHLDVGLRFSELKTKYRASWIADPTLTVESGGSGGFTDHHYSGVTIRNGYETTDLLPATDKWQLWNQFRSYGGAGDTFVEERSIRERDATLNLTVHSKQSWGTPFANVDAGVTAYEWEMFGMTLEREYFVYEVSAGVELEMGRMFSITPSVSFRDVPKYDNHDEFRYGLRAHYWLCPHAGIVVNAVRNDDQDVFYRAGLTVGF